MKTIEENKQKLEKLKIVLFQFRSYFRYKSFKNVSKKINVLDNKKLLIFESFFTEQGYNSVGVELQIVILRSASSKLVIS
jgi:hypothetical protein